MYYMSILVSFRIEESKRDELDAIAKNLDRGRSYILNQAIDGYLDVWRWQKQHIEAGIADTEAGRSYSTEEARKMLKKHIAKRSGRK